MIYLTHNPKTPRFFLIIFFNFFLLNFPPFGLFFFIYFPMGYIVVVDPIDFHCLETWNFLIVFIYLFIGLTKVDCLEFTHTHEKRKCISFIIKSINIIEEN